MRRAMMLLDGGPDARNASDTNFPKGTAGAAVRRRHTPPPHSAASTARAALARPSGLKAPWAHDKYYELGGWGTRPPAWPRRQV